jgi:glycosyltransferase involved in cell wall biosynthesis
LHSRARQASSLRIGVVTPRFGPAILGGAELHARWLAERLSLAGHQVEVFTTCALDSATWENQLEAGTEQHGECLVRRYPVDRPDHRARGELDRRIRLGQRLSLEEEERWLRAGPASAAMEEDLRRRAPELDAVVGLPYLAGTTYFAFQAVPERFFLVPCLHDEPFARLSTTGRMLASARGVLFNTPPERGLARRLVPDLARSAVVGLGFDPPATADPEAFRAKYGVRAPFAAFVGRLERDKNVPLLIRYFLRYKERRDGDLELLLVGDGDVQPPADRHVQRLSIDWADRDAMLQAASLLFQPSLNESLAIVMMQAWLCGTPILVHAGGEVSTYHCRRSNGGLWFANYPEFEEMVARLERDERLREALGANGRDYVRSEYGWPAVLERFEAALAASGVGGGG